MADSLIERLAAAQGPSRELDAEIAYFAIGEPRGNRYWQWRGMQPKDAANVTIADYWRARAPKFTESIDAALTLVPEGWALLRLDQYYDQNNPSMGWGAKLRCYERPETGLIIGERLGGNPALALCIAALKARAALPAIDGNARVG